MWAHGEENHPQQVKGACDLFRDLNWVLQGSGRWGRREGLVGDGAEVWKGL